MTAGVPRALHGAQQGQQSSTAVAFNGTTNAYNNTQVGGSYDRVIYLDTSGKLRFGVNPGATTTVVSPLSYDDGSWHHVAATFSPANGMRLYVDGLSVATNPGVTTADSYAGHWRWGGSQITGWNSRPNNGFLVGTLDEVSVTYSELSAQQIAWHYHANH